MSVKGTLPRQRVVEWLELIEVDLTAGDLPAKIRLALTRDRVRAILAKAKEQP